VPMVRRSTEWRRRDSLILASYLSPVAAAARRRDLRSHRSVTPAQGILGELSSFYPVPSSQLGIPGSAASHHLPPYRAPWTADSLVLLAASFRFQARHGHHGLRVPGPTHTIEGGLCVLATDLCFPRPAPW
jgi:hypothetical protein